MLPILEIFMAMVGAMMSGAAALSQNNANQQNINLAQETLNRQQKFSEEAAENAQRRQIDMYKNFFSPQAQMQQYKEAGLSPGLIYAKGGVGGSSTAGAQAQVPTATVPYINPLIGQGQMAEAMNVIKTLTEAQKTKSETSLNETKADEIRKNIEVLNASIAEIESKTKVNVTTAAMQEVQKEIMDVQLKYDKDTLQDRINSVTEQFEILQKTKQEIGERIKNLEIANKYQDEYWRLSNDKLQKEIDLLVEEKGLTTAKAALTKIEKELTEKQKEQMDLEIRKLKVIVGEYEKYGYKTTEANNWATELMSLLRTIWNKITNDENKEAVQEAVKESNEGHKAARSWGGGHM